MSTTSRLTPEHRQQIREVVAALPALTDEQLDALCDVLVQIRLQAPACDHCHDDPPKGHVCPRCGRAARS